MTEEEDEDEEEEDLGSGSADCQFREDSSEDEDKTSAASVPKDQGEEEERAREALKKRLERLHRELRLNLVRKNSVERGSNIFLWPISASMQHIFSWNKSRSF